MAALAVTTAGFAASIAASLVALGAFLLIVFKSAPRSRVWVYLGTISYSLYLTHVPLGGRIVNLVGRFF